jgi:hypothetical protein
MKKFSKYVDLDVHQETIAVAVADTAGELRYMGEIVNTPEAIAKLVARSLAKPGWPARPFRLRGRGWPHGCHRPAPCRYIPAAQSVAPAGRT